MSLDFASIPNGCDMIAIDGQIHRLDNDSVKLLNLLNDDDSRVWKEVRFWSNFRNQPSSPAFMAILIAAMKKTKYLVISCTLMDRGAYSCLASGLVTADGIHQELELKNVERLEEDTAKVLAEALVCTTSLKRLTLRAFQEPKECVRNVFAEALKRMTLSIEAVELLLNSNINRKCQGFLLRWIRQRKLSSSYCPHYKVIRIYFRWLLEFD